MLGLGENRLSIYLNDHLAGATVGLELARRTVASNRSTRYARVLEAIVDEIEDDREALLDVMTRLSVKRDRVKVALAWGAEKAGRLKLNGELLEYSPLSRLVEFEGLSVGIEGKLRLWQTLRDTHGEDPRLRDVDLGRLIDRARSQRRRMEHQRRRAGEEALT